jgi:hypothetical protein
MPNAAPVPAQPMAREQKPASVFPHQLRPGDIVTDGQVDQLLLRARARDGDAARPGR